MRHGSLFSGIGGFDLAAEWMGWENVFHCEWMEFPRKVLDYYWPNADSLHDIRQINFTKYANKIDILTGGFPCQPYSMAGKRKGKEDDRHLWPEMLRAVREIKPKYIVGENVFGLLNWNGGMVFDEVHSDLEFEGYEVQAVVIPAAAVNAPHGRDRVWFVATDTRCDANGLRTKGRMEMDGEILEGRKREKTPNGFNNDSKNGNVTHSNGNGFNQCNGNDEINTGEGWINAQCNTNTGNVDGDATHSTSTRRGEDNGQRKSRFNDQKSTPNDWDNFPTQSPICGGDDGLPTELDGITFSKWRAESIKGYGNAIVPQVALEIFKALEKL